MGCHGRGLGFLLLGFDSPYAITLALWCSIAIRISFLSACISFELLVLVLQISSLDFDDVGFVFFECSFDACGTWLPLDASSKINLMELVGVALSALGFFSLG